MVETALGFNGNILLSIFRVFFQEESGQAISPFHDIPMFADSDKKVYNMVVEVPRWTNAKMEIATGEPLNPIKQDQKNNKLRFVKNPFPHHGYIWNYGAIPQTWEDPGKIDHNTNAKGDNDPIDICEIGHRVARRGDVIQVSAISITQNHSPQLQAHSDSIFSAPVGQRHLVE